MVPLHHRQGSEKTARLDSKPALMQDSKCEMQGTFAKNPWTRETFQAGIEAVRRCISDHPSDKLHHIRRETQVRKQARPQCTAGRKHYCSHIKAHLVQPVRTPVCVSCQQKAANIAVLHAKHVIGQHSATVTQNKPVSVGRAAFRHSVAVVEENQRLSSTRKPWLRSDKLSLLRCMSTYILVKFLTGPLRQR